jgi:hypothetical protein
LIPVAVSGVFGSRFELLALLRSGVGFGKCCLCAASRVSSFGSQGAFLEEDRAFLLPVCRVVFPAFLFDPQVLFMTWMLLFVVAVLELLFCLP